MANRDVFCNSPWYELHIYWDGSFGFCCAASHKTYADNLANQYCVQRMSIREWFDSQPMRQVRMNMFADKKNSLCARCAEEERFGVTSRRHRSNQKSVIFTRTAFDESYKQSPGNPIFEHARSNNGGYVGLPIDIHIDLGNHCNLACKMCAPEASSRVATQYARWNISDATKYINSDWTRDEATWRRLLEELTGIGNLKNIHVMGGETLLTKRFDELVDFMIDRERFDIGFSFVTNGTIFNESLLNKLSKFSRVGIEVSIESLDATNCYQRQGTDQEMIMHNLSRYMSWCDGDKITLTLRPAISALTVGSYPTLLRYAYQHQLIIKSVLVRNPKYLDVRVLPQHVRQHYLEKFHNVAADLDLDRHNTQADFNETNPCYTTHILKNQIEICQALLNSNELPDADQLRAEMVTWCRRWDDIYGYDARVVYPEFVSMLDQHGY